MTSKGKQELDEYIFTRPEMARLLNISTNALRCRMRKGKCDLEYRFDGNQFKFKRPPRDRVITMMTDPPKTTHENALRDYDRKVQKRLNRGATHKSKGNYPNEVFRLQNEMKILNSIHGRFKSEEHRKRFEKLNDNALEKIDKDIRKDNERKASNTYYGRPKYGGMVYGQYNSLNYKQWDRPYNLDEPRPPSSSFHIGGKPYSEYGIGKKDNSFYLDSSYQSGRGGAYQIAVPDDPGSVELGPIALRPGDHNYEREPISKVQESILRLEIEALKKNK